MTQETQAKKYHKIKNLLFLLELILSILFLLLFFFSGLSLHLKNSLAKLTPNLFFINAAYLFIFASLHYIVQFPLDIYEGYFLEHRFNLSNQKFFQWFFDSIKKVLISFIVFVITIELIYFVLDRFPQKWWIFAAAIWLLINLLLSRIMPTVIIPLFYQYIPLEDQKLRDKIFSLFNKCGVKIKDVYVINMSSKTKKANAFVCGLGRNRRVVLGDTLVKEFSSEEIESVVSHELGHYKNHDIFKMIILSCLLSFLAFYSSDIFLNSLLRVFGFSNIADIAFFPLFALCLLFLSLVILPLQNGFSRFLERKADLFSLRLTNSADSFISMMEKLGKINLADPCPGRFIEIFLYTHPPISKRIKFAEEFKRNLVL